MVDANGSLTSEYSYSAWGSLRDPDDWTLCGDGSNDDGLVLGRGYTGHEYLPWFGLVNMNARLYDPSLGRFLSPDPYVQAPDFSQAFNRYSYALNNPLKYQDESGEKLILSKRGDYYLIGWSFEEIGISFGFGIALQIGKKTTGDLFYDKFDNPFSPKGKELKSVGLFVQAGVTFGSKQMGAGVVATAVLDWDLSEKKTGAHLTLMADAYAHLGPLAAMASVTYQCGSDIKLSASIGLYSSFANNIISKHSVFAPFLPEIVSIPINQGVRDSIQSSTIQKGKNPINQNNPKKMIQETNNNHEKPIPFARYLIVP